MNRTIGKLFSTHVLLVVIFLGTLTFIFYHNTNKRFDIVDRKLDSIQVLVINGNREHQVILDSLAHHRMIADTIILPPKEYPAALMGRMEILMQKMMTIESILKSTRGSIDSGAIDSLRKDHGLLTKQLSDLNRKFGTYTKAPDKISIFVKIFGWFFFVAMIVSGIAYFFVAQKQKMIFASATVISAIFSTATKYLFKPEAEFSFEPKICLWCDCETTTDTLKVREKKCDSIYVYTDSIGPFEEGKAEIPIGEFQNLRQFIGSNVKLTEVDFTGAVDKRPLVGEAYKKYRDNQTLAQARANYIKDCLKIKKKVLINIGINGANFPHMEDSAGMAKSRFVKVTIKYKKQKDLKK